MISIIVPVLNEGPLIRRFLAHLRERAIGAEIVVADGGSTDGTADLAAGFCDRTIVTQPDRARQMNAGADAAHGNILWFVHADVEVPAGCLDEITRIMEEPNIVGGYFRIRVPGPSIYRLTDSFAHYAGMLLRMRCGDHEFFRRLHRCGRVAHSRRRIVVSPRRYEAIGAARLTFAYGLIAILYVFRVSLPTLASMYERLCCQAE